MGVRDLLSELIDFLEFMGILWIYLLIGFLFMVVIPLALLVGLDYLIDFILKHLGV